MERRYASLWSCQNTRIVRSKEGIKTRSSRKAHPISHSDGGMDDRLLTNYPGPVCVQFIHIVQWNPLCFNVVTMVQKSETSLWWHYPPSLDGGLEANATPRSGRGTSVRQKTKLTRCGRGQPRHINSLSQSWDHLTAVPSRDSKLQKNLFIVTGDVFLTAFSLIWRTVYCTFICFHLFFRKTPCQIEDTLTGFISQWKQSGFSQETSSTFGSQKWLQQVVRDNCRFDGIAQTYVSPEMTGVVSAWEVHGETNVNFAALQSFDLLRSGCYLKNSEIIMRSRIFFIWMASVPRRNGGTVKICRAVRKGFDMPSPATKKSSAGVKNLRLCNLHSEHSCGTPYWKTLSKAKPDTSVH